MSIGARHFMREKISVGPETSAQDAAMKMMSSGLPAIPVVDGDQNVLGVVSENAVLEELRKGRDLEDFIASAIMVPVPLTADVTTSTDELVRMLLESQCCSVITIVNNGKYAGIVSRHMLLDIFTSPHYSRFVQKDRKGPFVCL